MLSLEDGGLFDLLAVSAGRGANQGLRPTRALVASLLGTLSKNNIIGDHPGIGVVLHFASDLSPKRSPSVRREIRARACSTVFVRILQCWTAVEYRASELPRPIVVVVVLTLNL